MTGRVFEQFRLDGRVALITGGAGGFGQVFAQTLAEAGADLVVVGRREDLLHQVAEQVQATTGRRVEVIAADVSDAAQVQQMATQALELMGRVDILINNAGVNIRKPTVGYPLEDWNTVLGVNLTAAFLCAQSLAPQMLERGWGRVINVSSMVGTVGLAERPAYTAAKGGLIQLTRTLALEWASAGVNVNALAPGPFATEMNRPLIENPERGQMMMARTPLARWGRPEELSGAILFLASESSSFMTGAVLTIDGGWTAQ